MSDSPQLEQHLLMLHRLLQSLNLPGSLQALEKPLGLPPSLTSHAEEIRQQDGVHRLRRTMHETSKLRANDEAMYQEAVEYLKAEAAEDDRAKLKHGTDRWQRQPSQKAAEKLYSQAAELDGYLKSAANSDNVPKNKLKENEKALNILSSSNRDIEDYVPSSRRTSLHPSVERAAFELRNTLNEVTRFEIRRKKQIEKLRNKAKEDNISEEAYMSLEDSDADDLIDHAILAETARLEREFPMQKIEPAQFEDLFEERLQLYDEDKAIISTESQEQDQLIRQLRETNSAFTSARKGDSSTKEREQALQRLETAYAKYKDIINNLNNGRKFYNDLAKIISRFREECKNFAYQRRIEASQLESDLSNAMSALNISQATSLQEQKGREGLRTHYAKKPPPAAEPLTAPVPTRTNAQPPPAPSSGVWNPELGIKFGNGLVDQQTQGNGDVQNPGYPNTKARGGQWDASLGVKFT